MTAPSAATPPVTPRSEVLAGMRAAVPILVGVVPFGLISGVVTVGIGLSETLALGLSFLVFAGASQLAAVELIAAGAATVVIIATACIINLRFVIYSASLAPYLSRVSLWWRALIGYLLTDQAYALAISHYSSDEQRPHRQWFYLGVALPIWLVWQSSTIVGVFVGGQIPASWSLDFAIPLNFMALLVLALRDRLTITAGLVAGTVAVLAFALPHRLGLIVAILSGIMLGVLAERLWPLRAA